jgi:hypothetical protein
VFRIDGGDLKIEHLGFRRHVDEVGASVQLHVGPEMGFIDISVFRAGGADAGFNLVFHQIGQVVVRAVTRGGGFPRSRFLSAQVTPPSMKNIST